MFRYFCVLSVFLAISCQSTKAKESMAAGGAESDSICTSPLSSETDGIVGSEPIAQVFRSSEYHLSNVAVCDISRLGSLELFRHLYGLEVLMLDDARISDISPLFTKPTGISLTKNPLC